MVLGLRDCRAVGLWERPCSPRVAPGAVDDRQLFRGQRLPGQQPENHAELQALRHAVRDRRRVATSLGYGPRFLHSTGQLHKGGPNTGVFLQITARDPEDLPIPGQRYSFGVLAGAQAQGDFDVLVERGRRVLWVELADPDTGLPRLRELVESAL